MKKTTVVLSRAAMLAASLSLPFTAQSAITSIVCNGADYTCQPSGVNNSITSGTDAIGFAGSPGSSWCAVLMFPLPTLPAGKVVGPQTTMTVTLASIGASTTINGDLWGVANFRTTLPTGSPDATYSYYLNNNTGPGNNSTVTDVKLVDNFLTPALIPQAGATVTTPTGTTNGLQTYIQNFYANNPTYDASVSQAYVWLRINPDSTSSSTANRYVINAGDSSVTSTLRPTLNLDVVDAPTNTVVWNGNLSADWDVFTANWKSNNVPGFPYQDGDNVVFDDTLSANPAVALNTTVLPGNVSFSGTSTAYTLSGTGKISGSASLTKLGTNVLVVDTDNDYTGGTVLAGGTVQVGNNDTHGSIGTGPITNAVSGSILAFNRTDAVSINSITRVSPYNATVVVNSGTVNLTGTGDNSGTLAIVKSGGTLVLAKTSGSTAHALGTSSIINSGGVMRLGGSGGDQIFQNAIITNNGTFDLAGMTEGMNGMAGNGLVTNSGSALSMLQLGDGNGTATFAGVIADGVGATSVSKTGTGTQTLTGTNTYTGGTAVAGGKLVVTTAGGAFGNYGISDTATLGITVSATNTTLNVSNLTTASGTAKVEFQNYNTTTVAPLKVSTLTVNGTLTINIASSATTFLPGQSYPLIAYTTLAGGGNFAVGTLPSGVSGTLDTSASPIKFVVATVPVTWNGNVSGGVWDINTTPNWKSGTLTGLVYPDGDGVTFNDTLTGTSTVNLTDVVSPLSLLFTNNTHLYTLTGSGYVTGPVMLVKTGTNTLIIDTDNDYFGGTVLSGGTLQIGNNDTHGALGFGPLTNLVGGSILAFNRTDSLSVNTITRTTVDNSARVVVNSGIVSLEGVGDNAGTLATVNSGGTLILNKGSTAGTHALSGALLINPGGTMQLSGFGDDQIYTSSVLTDNGTFDLNGHNEGFDGLLGNGTVTVSGGSSTLQLGENNGSCSFAGALNNGGGMLALTKTGSGTLALTGASTYSGDTTVNGGKLFVNTASTGGGGYTVADSATLGANVATANGTLNMSSLTLGNSTLEFQNLNSTTTAAITTASLNNASPVTINITNGTFVAGQHYPLIAYSASPGAGTFTLHSLPPGLTANLDTSGSPITLVVTGTLNVTPTNILFGRTNGVLTLQWPADHTGWLLQSNAVSLTSPNSWFVVPGSDSTNVVNIPISTNTPAVFYRLTH